MTYGISPGDHQLKFSILNNRLEIYPLFNVRYHLMIMNIFSKCIAITLTSENYTRTKVSNVAKFGEGQDVFFSIMYYNS